MRGKFTYVVWIQYLGFRFSGWQRQPGQKTIEGMIRKTLKFVRPGKSFKILGASRTDAKVSAFRMAFQLISEDDLNDQLPEFIEKMNENLPPDIRLLRMHQAREGLNIIKDARKKEYVYFFSCGAGNHPFSAPFIVNFQGELDIDLMRDTALLFEGDHSFHNFTARLKEGKQVRRNVSHCRITENKELTANFFPDKHYVLRVRGDGFMRYQIRMMMGALVLVGSGKMEPAILQKALQEGEKVSIPYIAPSSGLFLKNMELL
ncbi:tRNA pseudouridine synthase A [Muriicola marianensis]|uniref:tRNA pseudouridine synthase A n=1 Tax=Muriicola marianensis TaxID=1324801 RepID=A0ABQ1QQH9_9FLAO|nr:tRNA pseudouridine(38-40) synthase TruA [Muriicola marianensis]GGD38660.1 tRNA pseudouridine synthase A [Muriicola marianensis]